MLLCNKGSKFQGFGFLIFILYLNFIPPISPNISILDATFQQFEHLNLELLELLSVNYSRFREIYLSFLCFAHFLLDISGTRQEL